MSTSRENTKLALTDLLQGRPPNGTLVESCGEYANVVEGAYAAYEIGRTPHARKYIEHATKQRPEIAGLLASDDPLERLGIVSGSDLLRKDIPAPKYLFEPVVCEGTTILAAAAKTGKTNFALNLAVAKSTGGRAMGHLKVSPGRVLYIDYDGSERGCKNRLSRMPDAGANLDRLDIVFRRFPTMDEGGLDVLRSYIARHPDTRLVVIDVLKGWKPKADSRRNIYDVDYEAIAPLRDLGYETGVSFLILHHTNQGFHQDPLRAVSGSEGLNAAADNVLILLKKRGEADAQLIAISREEEDAEFALRFDPTILTWVLRGRSHEVAKTDERQKIVDAIKVEGPMSPKEIAEVTGDKDGNVKRLVRKMIEEGTLYQERERGPYSLPPYPGNPGNQPRPE